MVIKNKNVLSDKTVPSDNDAVFYCPSCKPMWFNAYHQLSRHILITHTFLVQKILDDYSQKHKAIAKKGINNKWLI